MPRFDPTINFGNILVAITMLFAGVSAYAVMNERIAKSEMSQAALKDIDMRLEKEIIELKRDIKDTLTEIKHDIRQIRK